MKADFHFRNIRGGIFKISKGALLQMGSYVQDDHRKTEAGGVMLGRFIVGTADVIVDQVTEPMSSDKRSRRRFFRTVRDHQAVIDRRWCQSRHRCNYLGGWHTHAESSPSPSGIDTSDWKHALQMDKFDCETLYFIIVGTQKIRAWEGNRHTLIITELIQVSDQED